MIDDRERFSTQQIEKTRFGSEKVNAKTRCCERIGLKNALVS
jgi:hypothetical protein